MGRKALVKQIQTLDDQLAIELYCDESLTLRVKVCHRLGDIKDRSLQRLCWL